MTPADQAAGHATTLCWQAEDPQAWLSQTGDKQLFYSETRRSFLMYAVRGASWVVLGDPVGDPEEFEGLVWAFTDQAQRANGRPAFFEVSARYLALWVELGLTLHKVGEEAVILLASFSLDGRRFKTMRAALNKRGRDGYVCEVVAPPHSPAFLDELHDISTDWLGSKTGREKGFSVGRFDPDYLNLGEIAVVRKEGRIVAFANMLKAAQGKRIAVDLMRYRPSEASGLMEYMFLSLITHYQAQGAEEFSLGTAPLSGLSNRSVARGWTQFGRMIFRHGGAFYNFEGLRAFKQKFQPSWRPRYLVVPPKVSPMRVMGDVALLVAGSARGLVVK
jgi:phosphatidylglycerol lysyltransferase